MTSKQLKENLLLLKTVAKLAAHKLLEEKELNQQVSSSEGHDIKISGDVVSQALIVTELSSMSNYPILAEESCNSTVDTSGYYWVVDPLDGSLNFSRDLPLYCISIALMNGKDFVMGVVYDPSRDEMFSGVVGLGAWLNEQPIQVSATHSRQSAVICTGFPSQSDFSDEKLRTFVLDIQQFKKVRLLGSAALSLAYVACGRADAYREDGIMLWDVAAGAAIVIAAGGCCHATESATAHQFNVEANNNLI